MTAAWRLENAVWDEPDPRDYMDDSGDHPDGCDCDDCEANNTEHLEGKQ